MPEEIETKQKKENLNLKKAALPLVLIIAALLIVTIFLNNKIPKRVRTDTGNPAPTTTVSEQAQSILTLLPNPLSLDANGNGTIEVNIETNANEVTAVQLELAYDPKAITNIAIKPGSFFTSPVELLKRIDTKNGKITYMIGISPSQDPLSGSGTVALLTFKKLNTNIKQTEVKFSRTEFSESIVAATGVDESVLKQTNDTTILLTN